MLLIGIAGGTGSGKSTVVKRIMEQLHMHDVTLIPQDSYYKDNSHLTLEDRKQLNFDHPDSIEWDLLVDHISEIKSGKKVEQPIYSYITCTRQDETIEVTPREVVIVEGILILTHPALRDLLDIKVFVDTDADERILRVIQRDMVERGRSLQDVIDRYEETLKPMHNSFIEPSKRHADVILPQGGQNQVGIDVLKAVIQKHSNGNEL